MRTRSPPPELIEPYTNLSTLPTAPPTPSPYLLPILSLLLSSPTPLPSLRSFCRSSLILLSPRFVSALLLHPSLLSRPSAALSLFRLLPSPNLLSFNTLLKACLTSSHYQTAFHLFRHMSLPPDKITYMTLMQCYYADQRFPHCLRLYHQMEEKGLDIPPHASTLVISALCKENRPHDARAVFDKMRTKNVAAYTALIDSFAKAGDAETAMAIFRGMGDENLEPDEVTYGAVVNCLSKAGRVDEAMELFRDCGAKGVPVNAVFYASLILGFGRAGRVEDAERLFREMGGDGVAPDAYCYNAVIDVLAKAGRVEDAGEVFERMGREGCGRTVYSYAMMIGGLFRKRRNEEALRMWGRMVDEGVRPNEVCFRVFSTGLCLAGKFDRAMKVLEEMGPMGVVPETAHEDMIRVLCKAGRKGHACKLADEIVDKGREVPGKVRTMMINALRKAGDAELAIKLVHSKVGIGYERVGSVKRRVKFITLLNR